MARDDTALLSRVRLLEAIVALLLGVRRDKDPSQTHANARTILGSLARRKVEHDEMDGDELEYLRALVASAEIVQGDTELRRRFEALQVRQREVEDMVGLYLAAESLGLGTGDFPLPRFVPIRVYTDLRDVRQAAPIREAVEELASVAGFEWYGRSSSEQGSWFFSWLSRSRDALSQPEVVQRLQKIERALELAAMAKPQAEVDEKQANAAAKLIEALRTTPNAACQIGSVLVVKVTDAIHGERVVVRTLTQRQMIAIERNEYILRDPVALLKSLEEPGGGEEPTMRDRSIAS